MVQRPSRQRLFAYAGIGLFIVFRAVSTTRLAVRTIPHLLQALHMLSSHDTLEYQLLAFSHPIPIIPQPATNDLDWLLKKYSVRIIL